MVLPRSLAVDATHAYWLDFEGGDGHLRRAPKGGGGTVQTLATDLGKPGGLVVSGGQVYWGTSNANQHGPVAIPAVYQAALDGTNPTKFADAPDNVDQVSMSNGVLFWNQRGSSGPMAFLKKALASNALPTPVVSDADGIGAFATVGDCLFYQARSTSYLLRQSCPNQTIPDRFSSTEAFVLSASLAADSTNLYFGVDGRGVMRLPTSGTAMATLLVAGREFRDVIWSDEQIYYIEGDTEGHPACTTNWNVYRVDATPGATPVPLVPPPLDCPGSLTADAAAIYWINSDSGSIYLLAK
jgi:hypothetical protein